MTAKCNIQKHIIITAILFAIIIQSRPALGQMVINHSDSNDSVITPQEALTGPSRKEVLAILQVKCNSCHKRKNPFMIFNERNMNKRVSKIEKQVFVLKRMPKEGGLPLTTKDYAILKSWIESINNTK